MDTASKDDIERLQAQITQLSEQLAVLRKFAPPVAVRRAQLYRFGYEAFGLTLLAIGAFVIYPAMAPIVIGGWMLAEVALTRRRKGPTNARDF